MTHNDITFEVACLLVRLADKRNDKKYPEEDLIQNALKEHALLTRTKRNLNLVINDDSEDDCFPPETVRSKWATQLRKCESELHAIEAEVVNLSKGYLADKYHDVWSQYLQVNKSRGCEKVYMTTDLVRDEVIDVDSSPTPVFTQSGLEFL